MLCNVYIAQIICSCKKKKCEEILPWLYDIIDRYKKKVFTYPVYSHPLTSDLLLLFNHISLESFISEIKCYKNKSVLCHVVLSSSFTPYKYNKGA